MADYSDCPTCVAAWESLPEDDRTYGQRRPDCPTCKGTNLRPITPKEVELALAAREWIDEEVGKLFTAWCRISGLHRAYGVERWEQYGSALRIIQDITCRGCYDTQTHDLPLEWLYLPAAEREAQMEALVGSVRQARRGRDQWEVARASAAAAERLAQGGR